MNGAIRIMLIGMSIFVLITAWLFLPRYILQLAYNWFDAGNLESAKILATFMRFTDMKACALELLAEIAQKKTEYAQAVALFNAALQHDSSLENSWAGLFESYICIGDIEEAKHTIFKAAGLLPGNELMKVYSILVARQDFKEVSPDEYALLMKHNINLKENEYNNLMDILLKVCKH